MKYAVVFPGQGSQSVNMLATMASIYSQIQEAYNEASNVLGYDLWDVVVRNPHDKLNQTIYTQPAMLAGGVAVWRVWKNEISVMPRVIAGHSLGEYTALVAADAIEFRDAVQLVALRGRLMQDAVPFGHGAMAAVLGLEDEQVKLICAEAASDDHVVEAVNFNAPGQVVIAGNLPAVQRAIAIAEKRGAKRTLLLPVSVPAHSRLMRDASIHLNQALIKVAVKKPSIPVLHNVDGKRYDKADCIVKALTDQLYCPVLWVNVVNAMVEEGVTHIFELGPGKVLTALCKRINKTLTVAAVEDPGGLDKAITMIKSERI